MSVTDPTRDTPRDRDEPPEFDLDYRFDDHEDPRELTVFPARDGIDVTTEWITVDAGDARSVEEIR
jgi:hypothetical protein